MSSQSVCQVAHSCVDVGSFHTRLFGVVYVTYGDFHDGSEKGTASVHHILYHNSTSLRGPKLSLRKCFNAMPGSRMVAHRVTMTHRETHKLNNS